MLTKQQADAVDAAMLAQELYIKTRTNVSISGLQQRIAELEAKLAARAEALKVARDVLTLAQANHGVMLMSDPPQDAWKTYGVSEKIAEALAKIKELTK